MAALLVAAGVSVYLVKAVYQKQHIVAYGYARIAMRRLMHGRMRRDAASTVAIGDQISDEDSDGETVDGSDDEGPPDETDPPFETTPSNVEKDGVTGT